MSTDENFVDIWCPVCGFKTTLGRLGKHAKKSHGDISEYEFRSLIETGVADGTLKFRNRTPTSGNVFSATNAIAKRKAWDKIGIKHVVQGGKGG